MRGAKENFLSSKQADWIVSEALWIVKASQLSIYLLVYFSRKGILKMSEGN